MSEKTVAVIVVETPIVAGVKRVCGGVRDSLNAIFEEIGRHKEIEWMHVRHEETASFAVSAQAHPAGELTVCSGSCAPGNVPLVNGPFDPHSRSSAHLNR